MKDLWTELQQQERVSERHSFLWCSIAHSHCAFRSLGEEIQRLLASLQKQREGGAEGEREKSRRDDSRRR